MTNFTSARRDRKFLGLVISIPVVWGLLTALWIDAASAADTRTTVTKNTNGSTTTCEYKTAFARINGENVIHKTWRCVTVKEAK